MRPIGTLAAFLAIGLGAFGPAFAETRLAVKHDHLFGSCKGQLIFDDEAVRYETEHAKHTRQWKYQDIQQIGLEPKKVTLLTYEDRLIYLGKDAEFSLALLEGQVDDSLRAFLENKVARPLVSSVLPATTEARYRIPVKHRKGLGGTQGALELSDQYVLYRTAAKSDSRIWRYDELLSVGSTGPFQLRITAIEHAGAGYGDGKNFVFELKQRLPEQAYDFLWNKINRPRIDGRAE